MLFSANYLRQQLSALPADARCWVAYSGGVDSHALLHALAALRPMLPSRIAAVHVNHGLQADAGAWDRHCRDVCAELEVEYVSLQVNGRAAAGESREAAARAARYAALADWLPPRHYLLTAQHQDDQAETLLLQLLRGSGVKGLAAMPALATFGRGYLLRPLLERRRGALLEYAVANRLDWVEDPSNEDISLDRNFLRHAVLPLLGQRWPALAATLSRSARHCAEAALVLEQLAEQDAGALTNGSADTLSVSGLRRLSPQRRSNALRHWLVRQCGRSPSTAVLARIVDEVLLGRADAEACVRWSSCELRGYRDRLYLLPRGAAYEAPVPLKWRPEEALALPNAGGVLSASRCTGGGLRARVFVAEDVCVSWRRGGERCRPAGRRHHHALKKLFQEFGIPPWERGRIPLVYIGAELAAVADLWVCEPFDARPDEPGYRIHWDRGGVRARGLPLPRQSRSN
jgi:tRNA(Ile)-lysidine synthase